MRTLNLPPVKLHPKELMLPVWLASKTTGNVLDVGCGQGVLSRQIALRFNRRRIIAVDWSQEHRIDPKQRLATQRHNLGKFAREIEGVSVLDMDPALLPVDTFQPIGFAWIDYDYSIAALRRVCPPILAAAPALANPSVIVAWNGYVTGGRTPEYPNEVATYIASLDTGGNQTR